MILSGTVIKASEFRLEFPGHFDHVKPDEFIIMPNHIHGILIIKYHNKGPRHAAALQSRFYDNIIFSRNSIDRVRKYLRLIPGNWNYEELISTRDMLHT